MSFRFVSHSQKKAPDGEHLQDSESMGNYRPFHCPEKNLVLQVFFRAWNDLGFSPTKGFDYHEKNEARQARDSAREWFESEAWHPFSFRWCTEVLGITSIENIRYEVEQKFTGKRTDYTRPNLR